MLTPCLSSILPPIFMFIHRKAATLVQHLAQYYPVVAITGPRQSGKTTLVKSLYPHKPYINLESLEQRAFALEDPQGFLKQYPEGAILDEVQHCPALLSDLQVRVDEKKQYGEFIITGSQQFNLVAAISQSLAGRIGMVTLLPLSFAEQQAASALPNTIGELLYTGAYPAIYERGIPPRDWYSQYVMTYLERDIRQLIRVHELGTFQRFLRLCAARTGQLLNLSQLAMDAGITHNTAKAWINVLEASYIVFLLQPYHVNFGKRLIKSPKLYFYDTGLASWLLGIQDPSQITLHPLRGNIFETWVISELLKSRFNRGEVHPVYFWRDSQGHEIDLIIEKGAELIPIEIKSGQTINKDYFSNIILWEKLTGKKSAAWLVYAGDVMQKRTIASVVGWKEMDKMLEAV